MELRPKPHQNHVSPTKHKVIMHTNSMPSYYNSKQASNSQNRTKASRISK